MALEEDLRASTLKPIIIASLVNPRGSEDKRPKKDHTIDQGPPNKRDNKGVTSTLNISI